MFAYSTNGDIDDVYLIVSICFKEKKWIFSCKILYKYLNELMNIKRCFQRNEQCVHEASLCWSHGGLLASLAVIEL